MNWFNWLKKSKEDLELDLLVLKSKEKHMIDAINRVETVPWYVVDDLIKIQTNIDVVEYKIKNYE